MYANIMREVILTCGFVLRRLAAHASQKNQDKDEEEERLMLQKARELDEFDQQNIISFSYSYIYDP